MEHIQMAKVNEENSPYEDESLSTPLLGREQGSGDLFETEIDECYRFPSEITVSVQEPPISGTILHRKRLPCSIILLTFLSAIGGFLFGYDTGVVSGAMILMREEFHLDPVWQELVVSVTIGAAACFAIVGGFLNDSFGRKPTILLASIIFSAGAVLLGCALNREMLLIGRIILGVGIGLASTTVPMYIAESAPSNLRGRFVTLNNVFICGGQLVAGVVDGAFSYDKTNGWRYMLGLAAVPAIIQFIGFIFMPETPRYLVSKNRDDEARKVLELMRGTSDVETELMSIRRTIDEDERSDEGGTLVLCRMLTTPHVRKALLVGCGLQLFQQISGINTVMYYSATIIKMSGVKDESSAIWLAALTAAANFLFTLLGLYLVEKIGRKPLTLSSLIGTSISLGLLAVGFQVAAFRSPSVSMVEQTPLNFTEQFNCFNYSTCNQCMTDKYCGYCYEDVNSEAINASCLPTYRDQYGSPYDNSSMYGRCSKRNLPDHISWAYEYCPTNISWMATFGMILYLACFAPGMGPMPWTINSEIYPMWARSTGNSIATMINWIANLVISMTFLTLTEQLTRYGAFWLYTSFALCGVFFISFLLPETKGKKLEEVEELFKKPYCS